MISSDRISLMSVFQTQLQHRQFLQFLQFFYQLLLKPLQVFPVELKESSSGWQETLIPQSLLLSLSLPPRWWKAGAFTVAVSLLVTGQDNGKRWLGHYLNAWHKTVLLSVMLVSIKDSLKTNSEIHYFKINYKFLSTNSCYLPSGFRWFWTLFFHVVFPALQLFPCPYFSSGHQTELHVCKEPYI